MVNNGLQARGQLTGTAKSNRISAISPDEVVVVVMTV